MTAFSLMKQDVSNSVFSTNEVAEYIMNQGKKFGFEKSGMTDMEWFETISDEVFDVMFHYSQSEAWEHLANRLAHRDAQMSANSTKNNIDDDMHSELFMDIMAKKLEFYLDEFAQNGVNNVMVAEREAVKLPKEFTKPAK